MTALDQAFIRAYLQRGNVPGATPLDSAQPVPLDETFRDRPPQGTAAVEAATPDPAVVDGASPSVEESGVPDLAACPTEQPLPELLTESTPEPPPEPPAEPPPEPLAESPPEALTESPPEVEPVSAEPAPELAEEAAFRPSFQVESFAWQSSCTRLSTAAGDELDHLADELIDGLSRDRKAVAVSGCRRGEGCTTLLLAAAQRLAQRGLKVAVVDADFDHPQLARRLGLLPEAGWEEVLAGRLPLAEALIDSVRDAIAVLPLCGPVPERSYLSSDDPEPARSIEVLRRHYDLVLIDLGAWVAGAGTASPWAEPDARWIDAVVLVHNIRSTPAAELAQARQRLQAAGIVEAGVVENFT